MDLRLAVGSLRSLAVCALAVVAVPRVRAQDTQPPAEQTPQQTPAQNPEPTPPAPEAPKQNPPSNIVRGMVVIGAKRYTEEQLLGSLGQTVGQPLDPAAIDVAIKRLWNSFHVRAEVKFREVAGGIELRLTVEEMPVDREPRFIGNDAVDDKTILQWAALDEKSELYLYQAGRVRQRVLEGYHREGFYFAEVNVLTREGDGTQVLPDVIFEIREGPKVRVKSVDIQGNESMPDTRFLYFFKDGLSHLANRELEGPTLFNWFGSPFVEETLDADLLAMRNVYRERGWLDAVVELEHPLDFTADRSGVVLHVRIDEGARYKVSKLSIEGVEWVDPEDNNNRRLTPSELIFSQEELLALCKLVPGEYVEKVTQQKDVVALREYYGKHGHITHPSLPRRLNWSFEPPDLVFDTQHHTVEVIYRIVQGRELKIREIVFAGAHHTRDNVLRRELSVFEGARADLGELDKSLARVQATRYFNDELHPLEHRDPTYRFLPVEGDPGNVDVEYDVDEGRVIDFNISGGVDTNEGVFGTIQLSMRNFDITDMPSSFGNTFSEIYQKEAFHGAGQTLDIELSPGTQLSRYRLHFIEPDLFGTHLKPTSGEVDFQKRIRRYDSHDEDRLETRLRMGHKLSHDTFVALGFTHMDIDVSSLDSDGVPILLQFQEQQGVTTLSGPTIDLSTRQLDNVYVPHKGYDLRFSEIFYARDFGSDYDVTQSEVRTDTYLPVGEKEDGTIPVLHFEFDAGVAMPYNDTIAMPYTDRYFLGGTRTLRGFDYRGVGPFDPLSGYPLGGETFLSGTIEYLYPLHSIVQPGSFRRIEALRGGLFVDFGLLNTDAWEIDPNDLRTTVGFSIGLAYPLPLTMNFGFPIRIQDGDQRQVFSFTLLSQ
jgi:outer membrane protein insertion porin family